MPTQAGAQISQPMAAPIGAIVTFTPGAGGSGYVEYTTDSLVAVANGQATWRPWPLGTVAARAADTPAFPLLVRGVNVSGLGVLDVTETDALSALVQLTTPWESMGPRGALGYSWATRPAASANPNAVINVGDVGDFKLSFYSDGTNYRPSQGSALLRNQHGSVTAPVASVAGTGAAILFGAPVSGLRIPASLLVPRQALIRINANFVKTGAGGGANCIVFIGTTNGLSDSQAGGQSIATGSMWPMQLDISVDTTARLSGSPATLGVNVSGASGSSEYTTNINTAADMFINFGSTTLAAGDTLTITRLQVMLFQ